MGMPPGGAGVVGGEGRPPVGGSSSGPAQSGGPPSSGRRLPAAMALGEWVDRFDLYLRLPSSGLAVLLWGAVAAALMAVPVILFMNWASQAPLMRGWYWVLAAAGAGWGLAGLRRRSVCAQRFFVIPLLWARAGWDSLASIIGFPIVVAVGAATLHSYVLQALLITMIPVVTGGLIVQWVWEHVYYLLLRLFAHIDWGAALREQVRITLSRNPHTSGYLREIDIRIPAPGVVELIGTLPSLSVRQDVVRVTEGVLGVTTLLTSRLVVARSSPSSPASTPTSAAVAAPASTANPAAPPALTTPSRLRAVLFDIDGTLLNSEETAMQSLQRLLRELTGKEYAREQLLTYFGYTSLDTLRALGLSDPERAVVQWESYYRQAALSMQFFPGITELLETLRQAGLRLGVVTSKNRAELAFDLNRFPDLARLDVHICSEDVPRPKPAPDALLLALQRVNVSPAAALYVGDTPIDAQTARAARVRFALAGWGARQTAEVHPDYWLDRPADLLPVVGVQPRPSH